MAPVELRRVYGDHLERRADPSFGDWRSTTDKEALIVEGWGEGFMIGALLIMSLITIANMRKGVLLHKLILLELLLAMSHGTFGLMGFRGYGWYLSSTAALLYCSYFIHNVVSWLKIRPFFREPQATFRPRTCIIVRWTYLTTLAMTAPVLIFQIFNNFRYFNNISTLYVKVRPYEPLMRDPWWVFACLVLFHVIRKCYGLNLWKLVHKSPRFGILLASIIVAIIFTCCDIAASVTPALSLTDGINPYWKLALVFKSLTDNIMLDDFKAVLQRLGALKLDGQSAMLTNSLNMTADPKAGAGQDDDDEYHEHMSPQRTHSSQRGSHSRISMSGRELEDGEILDQYGYTRRRQSMATSGVGKIGRKIKKLGGLASIHKSAEKEAQRNMKLNKIASENDEGGQHNASPQDSARSDSTMVASNDSPTHNATGEDSESIDFITSALR